MPPMCRQTRQVAALVWAFGEGWRCQARRIATIDMQLPSWRGLAVIVMQACRGKSFRIEA